MSTAAALVLPVLLWQTWSFLAPAVSPRRPAHTRGFVALATALFAAGIAFGYVVARCRERSTSSRASTSELYDIQIRASYYYGFVALTLFALGLAFQLPIAILALTRLERTERYDVTAQPAGRVRDPRRLRSPAADGRPGIACLEVVPLLALVRALRRARCRTGAASWRTALATERL